MAATIIQFGWQQINEHPRWRVDINKLPIVFNIAWYEQKAIIVHLALLYLGIKNTHIGSTLLGFMTPDVLKVVQDKFGVQTITTIGEDMKIFGLG
jgi:hydroxylamine reductase